MSLYGHKTYQQNALDALDRYLRLTVQSGDADSAYYQLTRKLTGRGTAYRPVPQLPGLPYVCLRIPTGGGKTVMACRAIPLCTKLLFPQAHCLVLWLVPTNTIKDQTLAALRDRRHPYRQTLDAEVSGSVVVMDLAEALAVQRATLDENTCILVSTLAALRVEDTTGRKIYDQNGSLMSHFDALPPALAALLESHEGGGPIYSLANVLRMRRPLVIMDEAHNARTDLSFDTLARFSPSCIIEFTATPAQPPRANPSNVLYQVSAHELKAEDMIKLPIRLQTHGDWREAIGATVAERQRLEQVAAAEKQATGEYVRPIALLQAEPRRAQAETLTPDLVRQCLLDLGVPPEHIAIETGEVQEVKAWETQHHQSVLDAACPIRFIVTVDKLREGWDCPFAYILCSVRDVRSRTAVEQVLGRVLRMPHAVRKQHDDLNYAYAFITSHHFEQAVNSLSEALTQNGFNRFEAEAAIEAPPSLPGVHHTGLFAPAPAVQSPSHRGEPFLVPQLALAIDGEWEPVESSHFLSATWDLSACDFRLTEAEFAARHQAAQGFTIDISEQGQTQVQHVSTQFVGALREQLALLPMPDDVKTPAALAVWLDRHIPHADITQTQAQLFLQRMVSYLIESRGLPLQWLARERMRLREAAELKIDSHRQAEMQQGYQRLLFSDPPEDLRVTSEFVFSFDPQRYAPSRLYEGSYQFGRHYYPTVGDMNEEEVSVAKLLDMLPTVRYWVRNVERRPESFSLPTSTDRFYPDFVALLEDDTVLVLEYKGAHLLTGKDTQEKEDVGALWSARSGGACKFLLVGRNDFDRRLRQAAS